MPKKKKPRGKERAYHPETRLIHGRFLSEHWNYADHIVPPMSASVAYRLESAERGAAGFQQFANPDLSHGGGPIYVYDRLDEPTRGLLEERLSQIEGGDVAVTFATGMAAVSAALGVLTRTGDTVLCHKTVYGCTFSLLTNWYPRLGINVRFIDMRDIEAFRRELTNDVMAVYMETPCNPTLDLLDLNALTAAIKTVNATRAPRRLVFSIVDNTFATPVCQRPLSFGVDLVLHSLTKNIGGFGTDMGGVVIGPKLLQPDLLLYRKDFGGALSPKAAWPALVYGLPTLALRLARQQETAGRVARYLEGRPGVARVAWPGLDSFPQRDIARRQMTDLNGQFAPGSLLYFVFDGDARTAHERGRKFINGLASRSLTITLAVSLGQVKTLVEHPASMTHAVVPPESQEEAGIDPGGVRFSFGLEKADDILADIETAMKEAL